MNSQYFFSRLPILILVVLLTGCPFHTAEITDIPTTNNDSEQFQYYTTKIEQDKDINSKAHDYIELAKYSSTDQQNQVINNTWQFFTKLNNNELQTILIYANETTLQGWIDLLYAYRNNNQIYVPTQTDTPEIIAQKKQEQKQRLKGALNDWALQYSDHPAKMLIPNLTGERSSIIGNGKKVALFLPLNGTSHIFGETIRQGYLDAKKFYPNEPEQSIIVLDTTSAPLNSLVEQAKQQGAEIIVGPLLKEHVLEIKKLSPNLPVLALNKIENDENLINNNNRNSQICFFALSPEDEAKDAAIHIYKQHKIKPLLLVPKTDLGKRVAQSFAKQWQQLVNSNNDNVISTQVYMQSFDDAKSLSSHMNHGDGIDLVGEVITTTDNPNSYYSNPTPSSSVTDPTTDFDAIYVYASYDELTFIKSMIEMKSTWSLNSPTAPTMFTSSKSNIANASTDFYYDMERVQFAEIPMIVNQAAISATIPENTIPNNIASDYSLMRLYAMGIDAWQLANQFEQLHGNEHNVLEGMTGKLSMQCDVARELTWQQYANGAPQLVTENETSNTSNNHTSINNGK